MKRRLIALLFSLALVFALSGCGLNVPRPEIKTGEFNFSVTYEYGGETKTISGVYVCEYDGLDWAIDGGYYREWRGYIKDDAYEEQIKLGVAPDGGVVELNLGLDSDCFMGDPDYYSDEPFAPWISVRIVDEGLSFENDAELIAEVYGARVISYECDEPITNSFGLFK